MRVGSRVIFKNERLHAESPGCYPEVGTVGLVLFISSSNILAINPLLHIKWQSGSTSQDDCWNCFINDVEEISAAENLINLRQSFIEELDLII